MKKCVLFDADGVTIHGGMWSTEFAKRYGIPEQEVIPFFKGVFGECQSGSKDMKEELLPWLKKWNWQGSVDDFLNEWFMFCDKPDEEMLVFVQSLRSKGVICCLATNNERYRAEYIKQSMGFGNMFDHCFISSEIGAKKPDMEFYTFILSTIKELHGIEPDNIIYADDSVSGIATAKKLSIDAIEYPGAEVFKDYVQSAISQ